MNHLLTGIRPSQAEEPPEETADAVETTTEIDIVCGNQGPVCDALYEWTDNEALAEIVSFLLGTPFKLLLIVVGALVINRILRRAVRRLTTRLGMVTADYGDVVVNQQTVERAEARATTIGSLLRSLSSALVYGVAIMMMFEVIGVSLVPVIAGAGVLGLAIGFGAQSVVEDLLRGVFMLAEDQFGVGDRIDVGVVNGNVERVTLRTTVIRDSQGTLWHVPNSEIDRVANEAQESSRATVEIGVSYDADLEETMDVLLEAAEAASNEPDWIDHMRRDPQVVGVQELGDDAVNIRVVAWVDAGKRRGFERLLRRRLKEGLDAAGIAMPNRQVDVWMRGQAAA